jgi:exonuclease III
MDIANIVKLRSEIATHTVTITGVYAPVEGRTSETKEFSDELQAVADKNKQNDTLILAGDFNVTVGTQPVDEHVRSEGEQTFKNNGRDLIDFCLFKNLSSRTSFCIYKNINKFTCELEASGL